MRLIRVALFSGGALLFAALIVKIGPATVLASFSEFSWRLLLVVCFPFSVMTVFDTLGWRFAFRRDRVPFLALFKARLAGEAFNLTTPTASVGGEAVKAWLLRPHVAVDESLPSVIVAKTTITIAQGLFLLLGIAVAWPTLPTGSLLLRGMQWLLVIEIIAVGGFVLVQLSAILSKGGRLLRWLGLLGSSARAQTLLKVDNALSGFYRGEPRRLLLSVGCHFVGWVLGALEAYLILRFLGVPVSLGTATVIEAFGTGIRFAAFLIPGGLGVLESGHVATFLALGMGAGSGLTFSLIRRVREATWVGLGVIALAVMRSGAAPMPAVEG